MRFIADSSLRRRQESQDRVPVFQNTNVQSAGAPSWMIRIYNSVSVRNVKEIMNIARITCLPTSTSEEYKKEYSLFPDRRRKAVFFISLKYIVY